MYLEREGRIDVELGLSYEDGKVIQHEYPHFAAASETIGYWTFAAPQLAGLYKMYGVRMDDYSDGIYLPSSVTRRRIGGAILGAVSFAATTALVMKMPEIANSAAEYIFRGLK